VIYRDLRGFIKQVDELGALRRVRGADPKFELGGITEVAAGTPECPALLFERIKGYALGVRVFTNATTTPQRAALALGLDPHLKPLDALKAWMRKRQGLQPHKPVEVAKAAFLENSMRGRNVDLRKLPAPTGTARMAAPTSARVRSSSCAIPTAAGGAAVRLEGRLSADLRAHRGRSARHRSEMARRHRRRETEGPRGGGSQEQGPAQASLTYLPAFFSAGLSGAK